MTDLVEGWKGIADVLGVNEATVRRWSTRTRDPLPLLRHAISGRIAADRAKLIEWRHRQWLVAQSH